MPPKNKPTAYGCFMNEYIAQQAAQGHKITMAAAQSLCSEPWQALTPSQKDVYKQKAKKQKHVAEKMSCDAVPLTVFQQQEKTKLSAESRLMRDIDEMIESGKASVDLEEQNFTLIHANMFCKTKEDIYIPAEIALVHFSLYDGEKSIFHNIITPGELPSGYWYEAEKHLKATHMLPFQTSAARYHVTERKDKYEVLTDLKDYLRRRFPNESEPILFAHADNVSTVEGVIQSLNDSAPYEEGLNVRISRIDLLLAKMKNHVASETGEPEQQFTFKSAALEELNRDVHIFTAGLGCTYHETDEDGSEKFFNCSLHIIRRTMYVICDHCAPLLGIALQPGAHCPPHVNGPQLSSVYTESELPVHDEFQYTDYQYGASACVDDDQDSWYTVPSGRASRRKN